MIARQHPEFVPCPRLRCHMLLCQRVHQTQTATAAPLWPQFELDYRRHNPANRGTAAKWGTAIGRLSSPLLSTALRGRTADSPPALSSVHQKRQQEAAARSVATTQLCSRTPSGAAGKWPKRGIWSAAAACRKCAFCHPTGAHTVDCLYPPSCRHWHRTGRSRSLLA